MVGEPAFPTTPEGFMYPALMLVALLFLVPGSVDAEDGDVAPGDGLGLSTNRPSASRPSRPSPLPVPLPGAGLGGLGAVAGLAAGLRRAKGRRKDEDDDPARAYEGDLDAVWGLQSGEEVVLLDPAGDGRIAIRFGPADADYVAILVPGTGVGLGDTAKYVERTRNIYEAAAQHTGSRTVGVIFALPFDSPDRILTSPFSPDCACNATKARTGGAALTEFVRGLDLEARRVTVIGHSYGSTVVGSAFAHDGLGRFADTAVFLGSPGVLAHSADELEVSGAVYAAQAPFDFIDVAGPWPAADSVSLTHSRPSKDLLIHGLDPTAVQFGAVRIPAGGAGHSSYFFDPTSLRSLGLIITGKNPLAERPWPRRVRPPSGGRPK
jgi:hypothetical protein